MKNRFKKTLSVFLTVCMMVGIFAGVWLGLIPRVEAVAAPTVTLTDSLGEQVVLTSATETATYSWDPETATLTLNGWSGQRIHGGGDYNLHLKGTNTIQMAIAAVGDTYGLGANMNGGSMGTITVTADEGGTLNILGNLTGANGTAIYGIQAYTNLISGKLNINITSDGHGWMYGTWGSINFVDQTDGVDLDVRVESTYTGSSLFSIYGLYNSGLFYQPSYGAETAPQNVTVNVTAKGPQKAAVYAIGDIYIHAGYDGLDPDIDIVAVADNNGSTERECFAVHDLRTYYVGKNATLDCTGQVRSGAPDGDFYFNGHTQSTTPADNAYIWSAEDPEAVYLYFIATDYAGVPVEEFVLAYNETLPDLAWKGGANAKIPGGKIEEDSARFYFLPYIKGASSYRTSDWAFNLKEGSTLPEGLTLYSSGSIGGSATQACEAGEVTIVATDRMGTPYDSADDRTLEFTVAYEAWVEPDRFLQVGSDPKVEIRENGSGTGWSYDGTTKILTLNGYNGGPIQSEWDLHIHLVGENTITMVDEWESKGIFIDNYKGLLITAAEGGKLNVVGTLTHDYFYAIHGDLTVQGGELNVDVDATFGSNYQGYGIWGGVALTDESQNVKVNVDIDVGGAGYGRVYGIYNGGLYYTEEDDSVTYPSATVSVNVTGTEDVAVEAFNSIDIQSANADIDIVAVASNNNSETKARYAVDDLRTFDVGPNVTLNCTGWVRRGGFTNDWEFNGHMQTTTPENNSFVWKRDEDTVNKQYPYFTMYQLDGKIVESAVFAYKEELGDLKWVGDGFISVPGAILGESFYGTDLLSGILNGSHYYASYLNTWKFEVIGGALPEGLSLHSTEGAIYGSRNHVYPAGEVTIRAIDKMGTEDDTDDRYIDFTVSYGAVVSNNPVTDVTLNKDSLILEYDGSGDVTATVTPSDAAYPRVKGQMAGGYSNLYAENISEPENGASVVTIRANNFVGKATFIITTVDMGLYKELTVYVREKAPEISIDYRNEELDGFSAGRTYIVTVDGVPTEIAPEGYSIDLPEEWIGKTVSIVLKHDGEANCNSPAQELVIPERPAAPTTVGKTDASGAEANDGSITGVADTMQYKQESQDSWYSVYSDAVNNLGIGTYHVRYRSTDTAFASKTATVVIGYGELAFTDNATFDILGGEISTDVSINVSTGVSGGKKPYTFSIEGPAWLSINATTGVISGTRPDTEQVETTATVTVTDGDSNSKSITINVGAVVLPHVHVYDQQKIEETYKKSDADCENAAVYYYSCVCGDKGSEPFNHGEKLGHDYTEQIEDEAHLKTKGADCQHKNVYWYDCSRCAANAKDDAGATDKHYEGALVGDHSFDSESWGYKGADGHAHLCKIENCDAHDTPVAHTPGDEATELAPQLCTVCSYEIAPKKPHVHSIQKKNAANADCTNPGNIAYYYCTGLCGKYFSDEAGTQEIADKTSVILAPLGHDYTEKLQNEAHVKGGGSNCKELYVYWYNCSRCTVCAKDDPEATDKFYTGTLYGDHEYDQTKFAYRAAEGHARVCKVEGCGAHDMLRNHNQDTSTYQKDGTNHWYVCSDCGYEMSIEAHAYTNACDVDCNKNCGYVRSITHDFEETLTKDSNKHWYRCTVCNAKKDEAAHVYANNCDATCDTCGHTRSITHSYASEWTKDENKHWHTCTVCGAKKDEAAHTPGVAATETTPQTCTACGYVIAPATGHITHTPVDAWSHNETHHWHACVGCLEQEFEKAEHVYDNACDTDCNVCGYTRTITHSYANEWSKDENKHWHECSVCGAKKEEADHVFDNACDTACNICGATRQTTHSYSETLSKNDGKHWYECTACGAKREEADHVFDHACDPSCDLCGYTRTVAHTYSETWIQNETRHWHACTVCGIKKDDASHTPGAAATETTPQTCTVCGYIIAPATGHTTHTPAGEWTSDATHHWHECTGCQGQQLEKTAHTYDNACDTDCNVCGKTRTVSHDYKAEWSTSETKHWHECSICSAKKDESTHTPGAAATETTPQTCTVCGYVITPATGHATCSGGVKQTGQTATCTTPGWKDYYKCAGCEKLYEDANCTVLISDLAVWKTGNGKLTATHNHGTAWKSDTNNHWNECTCGDKANTAPHADADNDEKCDTCGYDMPATGTEPGTEPDNSGTKIEDTESGASVQIPEGSNATVPDGAVFEAVELPKTEISDTTFTQITETVEGSADVLAVYELSLLLDGATVQPNGKLLVTLPAIKGDFERVKVLYIADDGSVKECPTTLNSDGTVSFETDHFSKYVVVGVTEHKADGGLPIGVIVIIVIAVLLLMVVGGFAIWWFVICKKTLKELGTFCKTVAFKIADACKNIFQKIKCLFKKK